MAQWLRALFSFPEDEGLIPSTHLTVTPVPGDLMISSGLHGPQAPMLCSDIYAGKASTHNFLKHILHLVKEMAQWLLRAGRVGRPSIPVSSGFDRQTLPH